MARFIRKAKAKGFSLVELLIVVAIIGVLSTIGVPTFRRMVTKAKKSEARTALGGLFTVESAFFTEYNVYGNRLNRIGFELEGARRYYSVGFPTGACAVVAYAPTAASVEGQNLKQNFPTYYDAAVPPAAANGFQADTVYYRTTNGGAAAGTSCYVGTGTGNIGVPIAVGVPGNFTTFLASATGNICPGCQPNGPLTAAGLLRQDAWTMDNKRNIANMIDGTN